MIYLGKKTNTEMCFAAQIRQRWVWLKSARWVRSWVSTISSESRTSPTGTRLPGNTGPSCGQRRRSRTRRTALAPTSLRTNMPLDLLLLAPSKPEFLPQACHPCPYMRASAVLKSSVSIINYSLLVFVVLWKNKIYNHWTCNWRVILFVPFEKKFNPVFSRHFHFLLLFMLFILVP